jgi:hypothetical protein
MEPIRKMVSGGPFRDKVKLVATAIKTVLPSPIIGAIL